MINKGSKLEVNMKFVKYAVTILLIIFLMSGCVSSSQNANYGKLAKERPFEHFFPSSDFHMEFSSIDEAYEYVKTADLNFSQTVSNKRRPKGLAARLKGPIIGNAPVYLFCMIRASKESGAIDLSKINTDIPTALRKADEALLFFVIYHNDRIVSLSNYYLDPKYSGYANGNTHVKGFVIGDNKYEADYPVGWGIEKSFQYLRGEID
jgi:hypothetical protein